MIDTSINIPISQKENRPEWLVSFSKITQLVSGRTGNSDSENWDSEPSS